VLVHASYQSHLGSDCLFAPNSKLADGIIWLLVVRAGISRGQLLQVSSFFFFFFHWHYSPLWALACQTVSFHFSLSITNSLHLPSSHSQHLKISFYFLFPSVPGSSHSSRPIQFLGEDLFGHSILHSLQVT